MINENYNEKKQKIDNIAKKISNNSTQELLNELSASNIQKINLNGIIDDKYYYTVFREKGLKRIPIMLFDDRTFINIEQDTKEKYHYIDYNNKSYYSAVSGTKGLPFMAS